jgi:hypothetical protein
LNYLSYCPHCKKGWKYFRFLQETIFKETIEPKLGNLNENTKALAEFFTVSVVVISHRFVGELLIVAGNIKHN